MTSDRMMQAIGRIERAITRLETAMDRDRERAADQTDELARLKAELQSAEQRSTDLADQLAEQLERESSPPFPEQDPHAMNPFSHDKALAALRSLDSLIDDLQKARRDG